MADHTDGDWRITEGPAFGIEPEFELSDIRPGANFWVTGSMSRHISAAVTTATPTRVESLGRTLPEIVGLLTIFDEHPGRTMTSVADGMSVELGPERGALWVRSPDRYVVHLYLPTDQFAMLLPLMVPAPATARLRIEVERTIDQGVFEPDSHFWNDRLSPVILFNEFEIILPDHSGSWL